MIQLNAETLTALPQDVAVPAYGLAERRVGIVHFGVGGFHRAHQALYVDRLMNAGRALDWAICGVGLMPHDAAMRDALAAQDNLFTLIEKAPDGTHAARVVGAIARYLYAPDNPEAVLAQLADPAVRIVSLTVTEGGYNYNPATGEFNAHAPAVAADLAEGAVPSTTFGYITEALRRRREAGTAPFTVMSCDNIQGNGHLAQKVFTAFARLKDAALGEWIAREVAFPNSMVDRITPVTTDADREALAEEHGIGDRWPVVSEDYLQWVLEDRFPAGRPEWDAAGVQLVDDVEPYELMKLRLLNASHQAMAYSGYLAGHRYAHEVIEDPLLREFLAAYMSREGAPTLRPVPGIDLAAYQAKLLERFGNRQVRDTLARLCAESSDRIPTWLVPVIRQNLSDGGSVALSAAVVATWARYAEGVDEAGEPIQVVDRLRDRVMAAAAEQDRDPLAFVRDPELFGDLADHEGFTRHYLAALAVLRESGVRELIERLRASGWAGIAG
ncbi:mannitol dehydrogenase family protein [Zafaria sp. J156]|uniref:mannitol dehydrogenase family protein n=1 Tax=Zafaria sp. J156 TaxID=3116490 RepID=UPI002E76527C|nr:mannitol dehydrogenase family protein [Zafaria sp. J156]MEE1621753.1 mannitol dehydrogenase family protein [Zafaria sp. J156]